jgi:hypothetical protein
MRILAAADRHQFLDRLHRTIMAAFKLRAWPRGFPISTPGTPIRELVGAAKVDKSSDQSLDLFHGGENLAITEHRTNRGARQKPA